MSAYLNWTGSGGSDTAILSDQIQLLMEPALRAIYPELDEFLRDVMITSEGVVKDGKGMSRDWKYRQPIVSGLAGTVNMDTANTVYGGAVTEVGDNIYRHSKANVPGYPDPFEGGFPVPDNIEVTLKGLRTSLPWPVSEDDLEALPAVIGPNYSRIMMAWARQIALYRVIHHYNSDDAGKICDVAAANWAETYDAGTDIGTITFTVPNKAINNFHRGMQIDTYKSTTRTNDRSGSRVPVYVQAVDHFQNQVVCKYYDTTSQLLDANSHDDSADTLSVYLRASYGDVYPGLNTWCKSPYISDSAHPNYIATGSANFFGVDLALYPHESSLVVDCENNYLSEIFASSAIADFMDARSQYGQTVDTMVLRRGAHVGYLKGRRGLETLNRQGSNTAPLGGGTQGVKGGFAMTFDGITVTGYYSTYLREGTGFLVKKADNNFRRIVPPMSNRSQSSMPPGFGDGDGYINAMELEFMGKRLGHASEFVPVYDTSANPIDAVQMIARSRMTIVPQQFAMIKIENMAEVEATKVA